MNGRKMVKFILMLFGYCIGINRAESGRGPSQNGSSESTPRKPCAKHFGVGLKLAGKKINFRTAVLEKKG